MKSPTVHIWTDGGGENNGTIGASAILYFGGRIRVLASQIGTGTNNAAETVAVLLGLSALKVSCHVVIHTDSQYVFYGIKRLKRNSMLDTNVEWWEKVKRAIQLKKHIVDVVMVEGHKKQDLGMDVMNNLADAWASHIAKSLDDPHDQYYANLTDAIDKAPHRVVKKGQEAKVVLEGYRSA